MGITLFHLVIVTLVIWLLEALHAIPSWIPGGGWTVLFAAWVLLIFDWTYDEVKEGRTRALINKEMWR
jgi:hypothetical protein